MPVKVSKRRRGKRKSGRSGGVASRLVLQRPDGTDRFGSRDPSASADRGNLNAWMREWDRSRARPTHPVVRLTQDGIDWGTAPQPGDEIGYGMHPYRSDDCLQAAIATVTQVPIEQVPDPALDRRLSQGVDFDEISRMTWERIDRWARQRGLVPMLWESVPVPRDRWIGVVVSRLGQRLVADFQDRDNMVRSEAGPGFNDHCLIMCHDRLIFDPSCSVKPPPGTRVVRYRGADITYGISFDKEE